MVSTTIGAEGLAYTAEENLLIGNEGQEFAAAVGCLLRDRELGERIAAAGRRTVEQHYDWRTVYRAFDSIYAVDLPPLPTLEGSAPAGWKEAVYSIMLASEAVLRRDWEKPEEEEAWANF